jgi:hypothetical protein
MLSDDIAATQQCEAFRQADNWPTRRSRCGAAAATQPWPCDMVGRSERAVADGGLRLSHFRRTNSE